jgi:hypothetical protein
MRIHIPPARFGFKWVMWVVAKTGDTYRVDGTREELAAQAGLLKKMGLKVVLTEERKVALEQGSQDNEGVE